jgi:hypothetical protein
MEMPSFEKGETFGVEGLQQFPSHPATRITLSTNGFEVHGVLS